MRHTYSSLISFVNSSEWSSLYIQDRSDGNVDMAGLMRYRENRKYFPKSRQHDVKDGDDDEDSMWTFTKAMEHPLPFGSVLPVCLSLSSCFDIGS